MSMNLQRQSFLIFLLLGLAGSASVLSAQAVDRPTLREIMEVPRQVGPITVSGSGDAVAYLTQRVNWDENRYDFTLWVARSGERPIRIAEALGKRDSAITEAGAEEQPPR